MGTAVARLGDEGSHGGVIITASPNWKANGIPIARVNDVYACIEHGPNPITTGSPDWKCNDIPVARIGSFCACGATIVTGSPNWFVS